MVKFVLKQLLDTQHTSKVRIFSARFREVTSEVAEFFVGFGRQRQSHSKYGTKTRASMLRIAVRRAARQAIAAVILFGYVTTNQTSLRGEPSSKPVRSLTNDGRIGKI